MRETTRESSVPELFRWLEERLKEERQSLAQQHAVILDELRFMASDLNPPLGPNTLRQAPALKPPEPTESPEPSLGHGGPSNLTGLPVDIDSPTFMRSPGPGSPTSVTVKVEEKDQGSATASRSKRLGKRAATLKQSLSKDDILKPWWHPDRVIKTYTFEIFFACLIFLQAVAMAVEVQYTGFGWGYRLQFPGYEQPASDVWPSIPAFLQGVEIFFGTFFSVEVVLKISGLRRAYLNDPWNWFDFFLVAMWLADMVIAFPVNSSQLRLIRLVRLLRLVRLVRVVRGFDSLIVMTTALQESANGLFWVAVIMLVVQLLFALLLNQVLATMVAQRDFALEDEIVLFEHFGTFPRSMLTMFQVTLGTWVPVARVLQEIVSPAMNIFTILHKVTIGFACIGVINGVFMQETLRVAQSDDVIMMRDVGRRDRLHAEKMKAFFELSNQSGDTMISRDRWKHVMESPNTKQWFAAQGLSIADADEVFTLLDADRSETMTIDELITGVARLHGAARSLDLAILAENHRLLGSLDEFRMGKSVEQL
ncbi:unnamed protein product [Durusdinium trenchii]|uniref:Sodium channel protein 60E (Drosophila ion channel 60) (Drosophila sodium channel 1) (Protein smell-impaired 60E) (Sodium channel 2) (DmNav2) n=2 Tax=Durusdinium trenchii TaxID=1381693 RepID=A0ABP0S4M3_9DINO